jgi:diguanylate cyclase
VPTTMLSAATEEGRPKLATLGDCQLTADDIAMRRAFFGLSETDEANLDRIRFTIREDLSGLVDAFYEHLLGLPGTEELAGDTRRLEQLRRVQRSYLMTLGLDSGSEEYVEGRLHVGLAHERAGLGHTSYLGAHARLFGLIARPLARHHTDSGRLASVLVTLQRILAFDAHLFVEAYLRLRQRGFDRRVDTLSESQRVLVQVSRRDSVTQIDARAPLLERLQHELDRSRRVSQAFSLLFIDLDHFKTVNDAHGHAAGDGVLRNVVEVMKCSLRPADIVGRYGGDEFLVGLVQADPATAMLIADRICRSVKACSNGSGPITVSIGCSTRTVDETLVDLIRRADGAMYTAKARGRNQACALTDPDLI